MHRRRGRRSRSRGSGRVTPALPPLHANSGRLSGPSMSTSCGRPDRIGPTGSASWVWNTAAKRVSVPSTISSKTMSALLRPVCGGPRGWLSILTTSAGRSGALGRAHGSPGERHPPHFRRRGRRSSWSRSSSSTSSSSTWRRGRRRAVVWRGRGGAALVVAVRHAAAEQAASGGDTPSAMAMVGVEFGSQFPQQCDALVERRMRVEQPVDRRPADRCHRPRSSAARSTSVRSRSTPSASPSCRPAASPAPRSDPAGTGSAGRR